MDDERKKRHEHRMEADLGRVATLPRAPVCTPAGAGVKLNSGIARVYGTSAQQAIGRSVPQPGTFVPPFERTVCPDDTLPLQSVQLKKLDALAPVNPV